MELTEEEGRALTMALGGCPDNPRRQATESEVRKAAEILASCGRQLRADPAAETEGRICEDGAALLVRRIGEHAIAEAVRRAQAALRLRKREGWIA